MLKRGLDLVLSTVALIALSPVLILVAILIRWRMGAPVFYVQQRPGLHERGFLLLKFRTMLEATSTEGIELPDSQRLTPLGAFLRSCSLDELPELWNVIRGDMSLVGPRPLLMKYLPLYDEFQHRRHEVRPGITGWAQINGRNAVDWQKRFQLDVWYVDNHNLHLDLKIMILTLVRVVRRDGISASGEATMPAFRGSRESDSAQDSTNVTS
jgi:sugar transferase EpsL